MWGLTQGVAYGQRTVGGRGRQRTQYRHRQETRAEPRNSPTHPCTREETRTHPTQISTYRLPLRQSLQVLVRQRRDQGHGHEEAGVSCG